MKKIPTLFERVFEGHRVVAIRSEVAPELQWVLDGEGIATEKIDGACCAIIDGMFYKRYDAKKKRDGTFKKPPEGAIPCCEPDPVTGHWPHWVPVDVHNADDRWFVAAFNNTVDENGGEMLADGTYEAVGPHFNGNPHRLEKDILKRHGEIVIDRLDRSFEGIRTYLQEHKIEGIVFWKDGEPRCKIKRRDFGFEWP